MKSNCYFIFCFVASFVFSCKEFDQAGTSSIKATINGKISHSPQGGKTPIRIFKIEDGVPFCIDSTMMGDDGIFSITVPADTERLFLLEAGTEKLPLFLEPGEHNLTADFNRFYISSKYSNSPLTDLMLEVEKIRLDFDKEATLLEGQYKASLAVNNTRRADSILTAFSQLQISNNRTIKSFINRMGPGPVAHLATSMLSVEDDFGFLDSLCTRFEKEKPNTVFTKKMVGFLAEPRKMATVRIGKIAPDFELSDPNGKPIKLSQFKGKWVLLDFWASWCRPCRAESPALRQAFKKFSSKGFVILSVSLDTEKERWMKAMIEDKLFWPHASDLSPDNTAASLYFVRSIPASFLIDPAGQIRAKSLRGPSLEKKLEELIH